MALRQISLAFYIVATLALAACATSSNYNDSKFAMFVETTPVTHIAKWEDLRKKADREIATRSHPLWTQLKNKARTVEDVQRLVNRIPYSYDKKQFGVEEYWQTPFETLTNLRGDCEDYAILKYYLLREMGYDDSELKILALRTKEGEGHAVLLVKRGGKWLMLDNRYVRVMEVTKIPEKYTPLWAMNHSKYFKYIN